MSTFLFSVLLETSAAVDPANMRRAVIAGLGKKRDTIPLDLIRTLEVTAVPVSDKARGIEAATLVELVNLKKQLAETQEVLASALRQLRALGN